MTVEAVKQADREHALVVRVSEAWGTPRSGSHLDAASRPRAVTRADVLERDVAELECADGAVELDLRPFELVTLKFMRGGLKRPSRALALGAVRHPGALS